MRVVPKAVMFPVFREIKTYPDMALGSEVVNFVWADVVYKMSNLFGVGKITVMEV